MSGAFENVDLRGLQQVLRSTVVSALVLGGLAFAGALLLSSPLAAVGIVLGLGAAILNLRAMDRAVAKVETGADAEANPKAVRKALGSRTALRLGAITLVVVAMVVVRAPLGIGAVVGLVVFQLAFVANVARVVNRGRGGS